MCNCCSEQSSNSTFMTSYKVLKTAGPKQSILQLLALILQAVKRRWFTKSRLRGHGFVKYYMELLTGLELTNSQENHQ